MAVREYLVPPSLDEAVELLSTGGSGTALMAGGTVMMPLITEGLRSVERVVSLRGAGLSGLTVTDGEIRIGATTTVGALLAAPGGENTAQLAMLREAARHTAAWAVRNLGTVGGNLFAVPKGGDLAVALLSLDASVQIVGPQTDRRVPLASFWTGPGVTVVQPADVVAELIIPNRPVEWAYLKLGRRALNTPAITTVAVALQRNTSVVTEARVALGGAGPFPVRAAGAEFVLTGAALDAEAIAAAADAAVEDAQPVDDAIASAWYRRRMIGLLVRRALEQIAARSPCGRGSVA